MTEAVAPDGSTAQTIYNAIGSVDHTVDAEGRVTQNAYDTLGQLTSTTYPDGTTTSETYDADGNALTSTDRSGHVTQTLRDSLERSIGTEDYGTGTTVLATTSETLDEDGDTLTDTDASGNTTTYVYDDLGRKTDAYDAMNDGGASGGDHIEHDVYDLDGRTLSITDANNHTTASAYDADGQLLTTTYNDGSTSSTAYDALGRKSSTTDQNGSTTLFDYDPLGRLWHVTTPMGHVETYGYDEIGEKLTQEDANGNTTSFAYDLKGHVIQKTLPPVPGKSALVMTDTYNPDGSLEFETDYKGATTWMDYDGAGRLIDKRWAATGGVTAAQSAPIVFATVYNADSTVQSKTKGDVTTSYTYDTLGRTASVTTANTGTNGITTAVSYGYDAASNKKTQTTGSGTLTYDYDADERLSAVHFSTAGLDETSATLVANYVYDPAGNRRALTRSNGIASTYTYDTLDRPIDLVNATASTGAVVSSYAYTLNPNGQRHSVTDKTGATTTYLYDADGRLYDENGTYTGHIQYGLDNVGNRLSKAVNGATVQSFAYDADDRVTSYNGNTATYSYDSNGNVLTDATNQYTWDWENQLADSGPVGGSPTANGYVYDADGLRVQQTVSGTVTNYTIDADSGFGDAIEDRDQNGDLLARYDYGDDLIDMQRGGNTSWYLFDGHGSTMQLASTAGAVTDSYEYDAFGDLLSHSGTTANVYLYDAQCQDATGLYYLRARYMDPTRGEFLGQDPFGGDDGDPVSLHRYLYAGDDPATEDDETGAATSSPYGWEIGNEVHKAISADFKRKKGLDGLTDATFYQIYDAAYGPHGRGWLPAPWNRRRVDLVDLGPTGALSPTSQKDFFEIKPLAAFLQGALQVISYGYGLNEYDPTLGGVFPMPLRWAPGDFIDYNPPFTIPLSTGDTAVVLPPVDGLILYLIVDKNSLTGGLEIGLLASLVTSRLLLSNAGEAPAEVETFTEANPQTVIAQINGEVEAAESIEAVDEIPALIAIGEESEKVGL